MTNSIVENTVYLTVPTVTNILYKDGRAKVLFLKLVNIRS